MKFKAIRVALILVALGWLTGFAQAGEGGGYANAGLDGQYFDNPNLQGELKFDRQDDRIDFDWGTVLPIGGSTAEPYKSFPHDNFSVRWTGQIIPRFSEAYTFSVSATSGVRVKFKAPGAADFTTLIDSWDKPGDFTAATPVLAAGTEYALVVEYHHLIGPAHCRVKWSSPSTPMEVIDPVAGNGLNLRSWYDQVWANCVRNCAWSIKCDADYNPITDGMLVIFNAMASPQGTYHLRFKGKAAISARFTKMTFHCNDKDYDGRLPLGVGYDATSNTTSASFSVGDVQIAGLNFTKTQRDPNSPVGSGVTDVRVMRPLVPGSKESHNDDESFYRPMKKAIRDYVCLRWDQIGDQYCDPHWANRTRPGYARFCRGGYWGGRTMADAGGGECWELLIMLANETGKDLHLCLPMQADDDYFTKLAQLIQYGSDGDLPYTSPHATPVYPPLNPNLRVNFEVGNEVWNWGFPSTQWIYHQALPAAQKADSPEWKIVNYDGRGANQYRRWQAMRTVDASNCFRKICGDAAMGDRIRPLIEYQYNNANNTALNSFTFLDDYYNNADGNHVADPHPVRYYIWGGGGATYYSTGNSEGIQDTILFKDPGFEQSKVEDGKAAVDPKDSPWTFTGDAGIYRKGETALVSQTGSEPYKNGGVACGYRIQVGPQPIDILEIGRYLGTMHQAYKIVIVKISDHSIVLNLEGAAGYHPDAPGSIPQYVPLVAKVTLAANEEYAILTTTWGTVATKCNVAAGHGFTIKGPLTAQAASRDVPPGKWTLTHADAANQIFGPINFRYVIGGTDSADVQAWPIARDAQAAFLRPGGQISQTIDFPKPGVYALRFNGAGGPPGKWPDWLPFNVLCDDQSAGTFALHGSFRNSSDLSEIWGSRVFHVDKAGPHTIHIVADSKAPNPGTFTVLDNIQIASADAILNSGFGGGQALGAVAENDFNKTLRSEESYAQVFGLKVMAYEGGWSLGGDFHRTPLQDYCKYHDDRARTINNAYFDMFSRAGGFQQEWGVYLYWDPADIVNATSYPLDKSIIESNNRLPAEADNGVAVPGVLKFSDIVKWEWYDSHFPGKFKFKNDSHPGPDRCAWLIVTPETGTYHIKLDATAGGSMLVEADGLKAGAYADSAAASDNPITLTFTKGEHSIRILDTGGTFTVHRIEVTR